jgi:hypothetical protein
MPRKTPTATRTRPTREYPVYIASVTLDDGRHIQFFANQETSLIVIDVIDANEKGGVEILRRRV